MANRIKENVIPISTSFSGNDLIRGVLSTGESKEITTDNLFNPSEVAINISGATTIDLSGYNKSTNFKLTLTANSTIIFTNMVAGQTGYITMVQNASTGYTLSYSGTSHGDTITLPAIGTIDVHSFILSAIGTSSAVEPIFGSKTDI